MPAFLEAEHPVNGRAVARITKNELAALQLGSFEATQSRARKPIGSSLRQRAVGGCAVGQYNRLHVVFL